MRYQSTVEDTWHNNGDFDELVFLLPEMVGQEKGSSIPKWQ